MANLTERMRQIASDVQEGDTAMGTTSLRDDVAAMRDDLSSRLDQLNELYTQHEQQIEDLRQQVQSLAGGRGNG